jgi:hypothetical protein
MSWTLNPKGASIRLIVLETNPITKGTFVDADPLMSAFPGKLVPGAQASVTAVTGAAGDIRRLHRMLHSLDYAR